VTPNIQPLQSNKRIASIDILRGVALFGILLVNVLGFNASFFDFGGYYNHLPDEFQQRFYNVFISLTADKFIFIFSFLFGYGINIQYNRFQERGGNFNRFFTRRMLLLALFGAAHILFLWAGDILFLYAIAGFVILLLYKLSTKWQIVFAVFFYFFIGIWLTFGVSLNLPDAMSSTCTGCLDKVRIVYAEGNYFECLSLRLYEYFAFRNINTFYYLPKIIGLTMFGFIASKYNFHKSVVKYRLKWSLALLVIAGIGTIIYFEYEKVVDFSSSYANAIYMTAYELMNVFVAFTYILLVMIISSGQSVAKFLKPLALMGRASLTNYLMQSLLLSIVFYGWGFGQFGQIKVTSVEFIALGVFLIQLIINLIWFRNYKQGPLEKLWRKWSYQNV
jgi:uncharacterized protein